eukprot:CAMPEP_0168204876 /NCGR_PEP_ID=MMETSP0140_2-20121125/68_1 /TAXON_ID=44445 /ORGANISM="Pseudo-nitzschia australis, Strain 10249 10 AB" /LENGTH=173 /DNA_ID=CAMNT_0008130835 /DNA_START=184 /DNA_END=703 /DNA_ORIENTATION=+
MQNENHNFPLFPQKIEKMMWKQTPINREREAATGQLRRAAITPLHHEIQSPSYTASEVAFPGGHRDESIDASLEATAIREAQEELLGDYPWEQVEIIGKASPLPSITGMPVTPVIAVLPHDIDGHTFPGCPSEVKDVFCVSLKELLEVETSQWSERFRGNVPVFPALNGKKIW